MGTFGEFHGVHFAPPQPGHVEVDWGVPVSRCNRVRVREHTCECDSVLFELCQAGGQLFIRRTLRDSGGVTVHESGWLVSAAAMELWRRLLRGEAR
ncbi:hypothetical protein ABZ297_05060 [Nonomuraea sp. NPDC005983]|uniref:hypothetical protein n=1 Tax=Nonomuraea sp. NPDC005983 TaxID=3155595 RepID=UPI0033B7CAAF